MADAPICQRIEGCRSCGAPELTMFLDLGTTALADRLLRPEQLEEPEPKAPLEVVFCEACALVQIAHTVEPEVLFCNDYPYFSSVSPRLMNHFGESARTILARRKLSGDSLVIEAASNDGYMLRHFVEAGVPVLGIDPAEGPTRVALARGVDTLNTFFTEQLAEALLSEGRRADVFLANNVLAHVADLNGFVRGIAKLLADDGVAVIECPYVVELIDHCEFDTIYHQHLCYFSVTALDALFKRHRLFVNDVEQIDIHGGSIRLFVETHEARRPNVDERLAAERERGVDTSAFYRDFASRVATLTQDLSALVERLKGEGHRLVGYGAAAKGCTMLAACGIDSRLIDYICDLSEHKQGLYMSGAKVPIVSPDKLLDDQPDYTLILAWNFADEIMAQQQAYRDRGGKFIVPVPEVRVH